MSDFDNDDTFKKLQDDDVKPIDVGPPARTPGSPPFEESDLKGALLQKGEEFRQDISEEIRHHMVDEGINYLKRGDYLDLLRKDPTLKILRIGAGWEQRAMEIEKIDIDLSAFIINRSNTTRVDEDFVFYNNPVTLEGGCKHLGDSRTGAGEGDDEAILLDLTSIPFDVEKIVFTLTIYDEESKGFNFSQVRDIFIRIVNDGDQIEICRFAFDNDDLKGGNGVYVATLVREGPKWFLEVNADFVTGGLAEISTKYGIIVRELQSTGA